MHSLYIFLSVRKSFLLFMPHMLLTQTTPKTSTERLNKLAFVLQKLRSNLIQRYFPDAEILCHWRVGGIVASIKGVVKEVVGRRYVHNLALACPRDISDSSSQCRVAGRGDRLLDDAHCGDRRCNGHGVGMCGEM